MVDEPCDVFTWRAHPAREHVARTVLGLVIIAVLAALAANLMGHALWALPWAALMVVILNRFFFSSRFSIDGEGITARYPLKRQRTRLDAFGGMHILFGEQRETVIARIRAELKRGDSAWAR